MSSPSDAKNAKSASVSAFHSQTFAVVGCMRLASGFDPVFLGPAASLLAGNGSHTTDGKTCAALPGRTPGVSVCVWFRRLLAKRLPIAAVRHKRCRAERKHSHGAPRSQVHRREPTPKETERERAASASKRWCEDAAKRRVVVPTGGHSNGPPTQEGLDALQADGRPQHPQDREQREDPKHCATEADIERRARKQSCFDDGRPHVSKAIAAATNVLKCRYSVDPCARKTGLLVQIWPALASGTDSAKIDS